MAKLNVFKMQDIVCMTLMKALLLIATLNMILFKPSSVHGDKKVCPNELTETDVELDEFRLEQLKVIKAQAEDVCGGITEEDNRKCAKSCPPKPHTDNCSLFLNKATAPHTCKKVCMCDTPTGRFSINHAWAVWLQSNEAHIKDLDPNSDHCNIEAVDAKCMNDCPKSCGRECKSVTEPGKEAEKQTSDMCFCTPPTNGLFGGHIAMPGSSASRIPDFCKQ